MKININGVVREMTDDEVKEFEHMSAEETPEPVSETDRRMDEIEAALIELAAMLTGGV